MDSITFTSTNYKPCTHERGLYKTIKGTEYLICKECGFLEEVQITPCYLCIHGDSSKGFPQCNNYDIPMDIKMKAKNGKQLALNLNGFKECEYFKQKQIKRSFWKKIFN